MIRDHLLGFPALIKQLYPDEFPPPKPRPTERPKMTVREREERRLQDKDPYKDRTPLRMPEERIAGLVKKRIAQLKQDMGSVYGMPRPRLPQSAGLGQESRKAVGQLKKVIMDCLRMTGQYSWSHWSKKASQQGIVQAMLCAALSELEAEGSIQTSFDPESDICTAALLR